MNKLYIDKYYDLFNQVKDKLNSNCLEEKYASIYLNYLDMISENITINSTQKDYEEATNKLYVILDEIKMLDHSIVDNYCEADVMVPNRQSNEEQALIDFIDNVQANIDTIYGDTIESINKKVIFDKYKEIRKDLKHLKGSIRAARLEILAYLLTLSVLISIPISVFLGIKKKTDYKVVYPTKEIIYSTEDIDNEVVEGYYNGMPVVGNVFSYNMENLEFNNISDNAYVSYDDGYHYCYYQITEKTPWIKEGREASRIIRVCKIGINDIGNIVNTNDFDNLFQTYGGTEEKQIVLVSEISRSDRQFYSQDENKDKNIYEVVKYDQDLNKPITQYLANNYTDLYIVLVSELLIWLCIVEGTNGLMIEGIINSINIIKNNRELTDKQKEKLDKLHIEYLSLNEQKNQKKKKKTRK